MIDQNHIIRDLCRVWAGDADYKKIRGLVREHVDENIDVYKYLLQQEYWFAVILGEIMVYMQGDKPLIEKTMARALRDELTRHGLIPYYGGRFWINHLSTPHIVWSRWSKFIEEEAK